MLLQYSTGLFFAYSLSCCSLLRGIVNYRVFISEQTYERVSVQRCESAPSESDDLERLGTKALYAFVYPNFMINRWSSQKSCYSTLFTLRYAWGMWITCIFRYGPWMDTNLAVPLGSTKCKVIFDYYLDMSLLVQSISLAHVPISVLLRISGGMPVR